MWMTIECSCCNPNYNLILNLSGRIGASTETKYFLCPNQIKLWRFHNINKYSKNIEILKDTIISCNMLSYLKCLSAPDISYYVVLLSWPWSPLELGVKMGWQPFIYNCWMLYIELRFLTNKYLCYVLQLHLSALWTICWMFIYSTWIRNYAVKLMGSLQ